MKNAILFLLIILFCAGIKAQSFYIQITGNKTVKTTDQKNVDLLKGEIYLCDIKNDTITIQYGSVDIIKQQAGLVPHRMTNKPKDDFTPSKYDLIKNRDDEYFSVDVSTIRGIEDDTIKLIYEDGEKINFVKNDTQDVKKKKCGVVFRLIIPESPTIVYTRLELDSIFNIQKSNNDRPYQNNNDDNSTENKNQEINKWNKGMSTTDEIVFIVVGVLLLGVMFYGRKEIMDGALNIFNRLRGNQENGSPKGSPSNPDDLNETEKEKENHDGEDFSQDSDDFENGGKQENGKKNGAKSKKQNRGKENTTHSQVQNQGGKSGNLSNLFQDNKKIKSQLEILLARSEQASRDLQQLVGKVYGKNEEADSLKKQLDETKRELASEQSKGFKGQFLNEFARSGIKLLEELHTVKDTVKKCYEKSGENDSTLPEHKIIGLMLKKYSNNSFYPKIQQWQTIFSVAIEGKIIIERNLVERLRKISTEEEQLESTRRLFFSEVLGEYISNTLILVEEMRNLNEFVQTDSTLCQEAEGTFLAFQKKILTLAKSLFDCEVKFIPLFEDYRNYPGITQEVSEEPSSFYKSIKKDPNCVLEVKSYGFSKITGRTETKVILAK